MLDLEYPSLRAFVRDCRAVQRYILLVPAAGRGIDYNPRKLLESGAYVLMPDGRVVASSVL